MSSEGRASPHPSTSCLSLSPPRDCLSSDDDIVVGRTRSTSRLSDSDTDGSGSGSDVDSGPAAFFFGTKTVAEADGPRLGVTWAKQLGDRTRFGNVNGLEAIAKAYPVPAHSFTVVPEWGVQADQLTRMFKTLPQKYGYLRARDDDLRKATANVMVGFGPGRELTRLLSGDNMVPDQVKALSASLQSLSLSIYALTKLRRDAVLACFPWKSNTNRWEALASEIESECPAGTELFSTQVVQKIQNFIKVILDERLQVEQLDKLTKRASTKPSTQKSAGKRPRSYDNRGSRSDARPRYDSKRQKQGVKPFPAAGKKQGSGSGWRKGKPGRTDESSSGRRKRSSKAAAPSNRYVNELFSSLEFAFGGDTQCNLSDSNEGVTTDFPAGLTKFPFNPFAPQPDRGTSCDYDIRAHTGAGRTGGCRTGRPSVISSPLSDLPGGERSWEIPVYPEFEEVKRLFDLPQVQDGESPGGTTVDLQRMLDGQAGSFRRILCSESSREVPKLPGLPLEGQFLSLPAYAKRPESRSSAIYKDLETSCSEASFVGNESLHLPRRHFLGSSHSRSADEPSDSRQGSSRIARFRDKREKVVSGADPGSNVPRFRPELGGHDDFASRSEKVRLEDHLPKAAPEGVGFSETAGMYSRQYSCSRPRYPSSTASLPPPSAAPDRSRSDKTGVQAAFSPHQGSSCRAQVVGRLPRAGPASSPRTRSARTYRDLYRCLADRVGRFLQRRRRARGVVASRSEVPHKPARASSGSQCVPPLLRKLRKHKGAAQHRQHGSPPLHQEDGRDQKRTPQPGGPRVLGLDPGEKHIASTAVHSLQGELSGRSDVQTASVRRGLCSPPASVSGPREQVGNALCGPVCESVECPSRPVPELGIPSRGNRPGCPSAGNSMATGGPALCVSALQPDSPDASEARQLSKSDDSDSTGVADSSVLPSHTGAFAGAPSRPPGLGTPSARQGRQPAPPAVGSNSELEGMEGFLHRLRATGFSVRATEYMRLKWRSGSRKTYQAHWKPFSKWCESREVDPFTCSPQLVADYLVFLFHDRELAVSSIGIARSAISAFVEPFEGSPVGEHVHICALMRAFKNSRPPTARYSATWSIDHLLEYWDRQPENSLLTLKLLTVKTVTLVATSALSRADEIASAVLENHSRSDNGMSFLLSKAPKNHREGPLPPLSLEGLPDRPNVCPIIAANEYITRTAEFRLQADGLDRTGLFLSLDMRHCNVKSVTIARWIREGMSLSGIDTSVFKAHSIRSAAVSRLANKGASLKEIMRLGRWRSNSVLKRFYLRQLPRYCSLLSTPKTGLFFEVPTTIQGVWGYKL